MKVLRFVLLAAALYAGCMPTYAQWQTSVHSTPVGRGGGTTGFNALGPCAAGLPFVGGGAAADPTCGPLNLAAPGAVSGILPSANTPNITSFTGTTTVLGTNTTYTAGQDKFLVLRNNGGAAMSDLLPGTGAGVLPVNTVVTVTNADPVGVLAIGVGAGALIKTRVASTGFMYVCPGQTVSLYSDGTNYYAIGLPARCILKAATTVFIAATGLATNDGLTITTPVLDPTFAYNLVGNNFDLAGNVLTFQVANGTYSKIVLAGPLLGLSVTRASANVIFLGNAGTPANVILSDLAGAGGEGSASIGMQAGAIAMFNGFQLSSMFNNNMNVNGAGTIAFVQNLDFHVTGAGQLQVVSTNGADFIIVGNYTISTGGGCHWIAAQNAAVETFFPDGVSTITITLTGTPAFTSGFACVQYPSTLVMTTPLVFSGGATGKRYFGTFNGIINTGSGNPNFFPGNAAGTLSTGAQYN